MRARRALALGSKEERGVGLVAAIRREMLAAKRRAPAESQRQVGDPPHIRRRTPAKADAAS
jgi:hypothetical protein